MNHLQRAARFKELHYRPGLFIAANAWDAGSAKLLEHMGFEALATTSAGMAFRLARPDNARKVSSEDAFKNALEILDNTSLPVSADLMNGFGDSPEDCAITIKLAASTGLAGASIEDATGRRADPIYDFALAVERIKAAVNAVKALDRPFMLTARSENFLNGRPDLKDTIDRLVAFADAGADVLFAPGLRSLEDIAAVVKAVHPKPVSVMLGLDQSAYGLNELETVGVKRVSLGSGLFKAAYAALQDSASAYLPTEAKANFKVVKEHSDYNQLFDRE